MRHLLLVISLTLVTSLLSTGCKKKDVKPDDTSLITERPATQTNNTKEAEAHVERAKQAIAERDWRTASNAYARAVKAAPGDWRLHMERAIVLSKIPDFAGSIAAIEEAMAQGGDREWLTWYNLGNIYQNRGMYHESITAYRVAIGLQSQPHLDTLVNLSSGYIFLGRFDEANGTLSHILSLEPRDLRALHNVAMVLHLQQKYEEALLAYDNVLAIDASYTQTVFNRAHVLSQLKRYREAAQAYERYIQLEPDGPYVTRARTRADEYRNRK